MHDHYVWALFVMELTMPRRGILTVCQINMHKITDIINYVCSSWLHVTCFHDIQ